MAIAVPRRPVTPPPTENNPSSWFDGTPRGPTPLPGRPGQPVTYDPGTPNQGNPGDPVTYPVPATTRGPGGGTIAPTPDQWASQDYSNVDNVKAYFKSRGIDVSDESAKYWADKYNSPEFNGDRAYFFKRLSNADEFGGPGSGGTGSDSSLLDPYTKKFTYDDFKPPTGVDDTNDPGFTTRMKAVQDTLQRSAASKGSLLSGSTTKAVTDASSDYASSEYQNTFNRQLQTYGTNRGNAYDQYKEDRANFYQNQDGPFAKLMALSSLQEQDLAGQRQLALGYGQAGAQTYMGGAGQYNGLMTNGANAAASGVVGQNNAYQSLYGMAQQYPWMFAAGRGSGQSRGYGGSGYYGGPGGGYNGP